MKTNRLTLVANGMLMVIAVAVLVWQQQRLAFSQQQTERLRSETAQLPALREELTRLKLLEVDWAELARLRQAQAAGQLELARLRGQAARLQRAEAETGRLRKELDARPASGTETTNAIAAPTSEMIKGSLAQVFQRRLSRMQEKLNLSPAQAQAIQQILSRQSEGVAEAMQGVYSGKVDRQKMAKLRGKGGSPEEEIRALLSPEQETAYAAMKDEDAANNARLAANSELIQMQNTLGLTSDQQDKVYAVLYDQIQTQYREESTGHSPANPAEAMQAVQNRRLLALEGILTPDQLEGYRQQQDRQIQFMKKIVARVEPAARP